MGAGIRADIVGVGSCGSALPGSMGIADRVRFLGFLSDDEFAATRARCQVFCRDDAVATTNDFEQFKGLS